MTSQTRGAGSAANIGSGAAWDTSFPSFVTRTSSGNTAYLVGTNFGFSIPSDATIDGIEVVIAKLATVTNPGDTIQDLHVQLTLNGSTFVGNDKANATDWPAAHDFFTYGSPTDKWGLSSFAPADANSANFGVGIQAVFTVTASAEATVRSIYVTIYYSTPSMPNPACPGAP